MTGHKKEQQQTTGIVANGINHLVVFLLKGLALMPLGILYGFADVFYFLLKNLIRYRSEVITQNLKYAFPGKTDAEIIRLRNRFYRYFCDVFIESLKLYHMSENEMKKRVTFKGVDILNRYAEKGQSVIVLAYHHHNWEWGSYLQTRSKHRVLMVYNKMRNNKPMDDFLLHSREKWGGQAVQMGRAAKVVYELGKKKIPTLLWLVADQSALPNQGMWAHFFKREAAFFSGPEKIARKTNQAVFFQRVRRLSRGNYEYEFKLMVAEPQKARMNEVLLKYIQNMENAIKDEPEYYLWSHRRWKHKRPEHLQLLQ
jgi:Kdo2-lipid IVA lauroyltransferase/acyltransferase